MAFDLTTAQAQIIDLQTRAAALEQKQADLAVDQGRLQTLLADIAAGRVPIDDGTKK